MADKRQRWHWFKFQCQQCETDSTATRKDARFCGVNCRTYWHKAHKLTEAPKPSRRAPVAPSRGSLALSAEEHGKTPRREG